MVQNVIIIIIIINIIIIIFVWFVVVGLATYAPDVVRSLHVCNVSSSSMHHIRYSTATLRSLSSDLERELDLLRNLLKMTKICTNKNVA